MTSRSLSNVVLIMSLAVAVALVATGCASEPETEEAVEDLRERPDPDFEKRPDGFADVEVMGVVAATGQGPAVLLGSEPEESDEPALLPIFISPSQGMAIQLGLEGRDFQRPLTHDLVYDMMERLDGEIGKVHVDDLREGTFFATVYLVTPTEVVEIDARPSDAIALTADKDIPVYVADHVMDQAGLTEEDADQMPPADPGEPEDYEDSPTTPL